MQIKASAGRHRFLDEFCLKLTLTADHPKPEEFELEGEFLRRLMDEIKECGQVGSLLHYLRRVQDHGEEVCFKPKKTAAKAR